MGSVRLLRVAAAVAVPCLGTACAALVGFESDYEVVPAVDGGPGVGGTGAAGGSDIGGTGGAGGATGTGGSTCAHSKCEIGEPLEDGCDACATDVCEIESYCCTQFWDPYCISLAQMNCGETCCGDGFCAGVGNTCVGCQADCGACGCSHSVCNVGAALSETACFAPCVMQVCNELPQCCAEQLGFLATECLEHAATVCPDDPCVAQVCADTPSCCTTSWTQACVDLAKNLCTLTCDCVHSPCVTGAALVSGCDPCVTAICQLDTYCCSGGWDEVCKHEATAICGLAC
jgi:hypothetical protein